MAYHRQQGVDTAIVRIFNTYGPRMRPTTGARSPTFMRQALDAKPLTVFGDGSQTRSFCYVDDLIRGLILLVESGEHMPVNIGNPASTRSSSSPRPCSPRRDRRARSCTKPCRSTIRRCGSPTSRARGSSSAGSPRSRSTRAFAARWRRSPGPRACVGRPRRSPQPRSAAASSSLPPRAARIRCASGSSTTGSSSTASPTSSSHSSPRTGARLLRVNLWWAGPGIRVSTSRPRRPADPNDRAYNWDTYDRTVRFATVNGIEPVFSILGTPPWANRREGLERRSDGRSGPSSLRGRRAEALQRHLQERRRRHPSPREPLDGMERAEQPCFPQAAVPPIGQELDDPVGPGLREDLQRRRAGNQVRPAARRRSRAARPARVATTTRTPVVRPSHRCPSFVR